MPSFDEDIDMGEELAGQADVHRDAYQQTIEDARQREAEYQDRGWETLLIPAGHTATEPPEVGNPDRFGLVHVIPDNYAEEFSDFFQRGEFPAFDVFRAEVSGRVFLVTELLDPDAELAIIIIANYDLHDARDLIETVLEEEEMYTHVQTLDTTHLGSFYHEDYTKFFPEPALVKDE